jgi:hypothetical protein
VETSWSRWPEHITRSHGTPAIGRGREQLAKLAGFYSHLGELARGYVKDPNEREAPLQTVAGWETEMRDLIAGVRG